MCSSQWNTGLVSLCLVHINKGYFVSLVGNKDKKLTPNKQTKTRGWYRVKNGQEEPK